MVCEREPLADVAIKAVEDGEIQFVPKQYENLLFLLDA